MSKSNDLNTNSSSTLSSTTDVILPLSSSSSCTKMMTNVDNLNTNSTHLSSSNDASSFPPSSSSSAAPTSGSTTIPYNHKGVCGILTHYYYRDGKYLDVTAFLVREGPDMGRQAGFYTAPMGVLDEESISKGVAREVHEELFVEIDSRLFRDPDIFRLVRVPFPGHDHDIRHNAVFISQEPLSQLASYSRQEYNQKKEEYENEYDRLSQKNYSTSDIAPFLETNGMTHVPLRNLLAAVPLNDKGNQNLYPDQFLPLKGYLVPEYIVGDIDDNPIELRPVFSHILSHPQVRTELQRQIDTFDQKYGRPTKLTGSTIITTSPLPKNTVDSSVSYFTPSSSKYLGVCGILTNHYFHGDQPVDITAFLIREGPIMGSQAGYYTAPMGALDETSISKGVAREVHEELHVHIDHRKFRNPDLFRMVRVPIVRYDTSVSPDAVFISKVPMEEVLSFSRAIYQQLKQDYETEYDRLLDNNEDTSSVDPFLETDGMTHVPLRNLLAVVPLNNLGDTSQYPDQFLPLGKADFLKYMVKDIDNNPVKLRPIFAHILSHPTVREELQRQIDAFDQRYGTSHSLSSSSSSVGISSLSTHSPSRVVSMGSIAHKTTLEPLQKKKNGDKPLLRTLPVPSQDPHLNMHLITEVHISDEQPPFRLYVGNLDAANSWDTLATAGITHVINCCIADLSVHDKSSWTPFIHHGIQYGIVNTNDCRTGSLHLEDPSGQWPAVMALLREAMHFPGGGAALVHCYLGKNRSVTTAAVFMALHGLASSFDDAVERIKSVRPIAGPLPEYLHFGERFVARAVNLPPYKTLQTSGGSAEKKSKTDTDSFTTPVSCRNTGFNASLRQKWLSNAEDEANDN